MDDIQMDQEISILNKSPLVALARKEIRARYVKQQRVYQLRWLERRGRELRDAGVTMESLSEQMRRERASWDSQDDQDEEF